MDIQVIKSPGGIEAWLVEEHAVPILSLRFSFEGGSSQDPSGKDGVANFLANLLVKGGGEDPADFSDRVADLALRMNFQADKDSICGGIDVLTESRDEAAQLLKQLLGRRNFKAHTVEHIRDQLQMSMGALARSPYRVANAEWDALAFAGHAYARAIAGTQMSIGRISPNDLEDYCERIIARDTLKVTAVGDITPGELEKLLDDIFADLPPTADLVAVSDIERVSGGKHSIIDMDIPQSGVAFGLGAVQRCDPDYIPAFVLNYIVGGCGTTCRLSEEVRQKRGLAPAVSTGLWTARHAGVLRGWFITCNAAVEPSLDIIRHELQNMATIDISDADLEDAKTNLIRSFPLLVDSNAKTAWQLLSMRSGGFAPDYIDRRSAMIADVTLHDLTRVGKRLNNDDLIVAIVGKPALQEASLGRGRSQ